MSNYKFGDILLLKFPFTDSETFKKRPALVIIDTDDADIILCRITSRIYNTEFDIEIDDWSKCGLKLASIIRIHKIATLNKDLIKLKMGEIDNKTKDKVKKTLKRLIK